MNTCRAIKQERFASMIGHLYLQLLLMPVVEVEAVEDAIEMRVADVADADAQQIILVET
jgi:hypothetical protein